MVHFCCSATAVLLLVILTRSSEGFSVQTNSRFSTPATRLHNSSPDQDVQNDGEVGTGPNWIERSFPVDIAGKNEDPKKVDDYNLGISGVSYGTGALSARMYETMTTRSSFDPQNNPEIKEALKIYSMDFTAKEAVRVALSQNGLELVLTDDEQDEGVWADIDSIRLHDENDVALPTLYDSWQEAVNEWEPGQGFSFVARQVPAKTEELSVDELLRVLDPEGELREQASDAGMVLPDQDIETLAQLAKDNLSRTKQSPTEAAEPYIGDGSRGYSVINAKDLEGYPKMHVMNALVSHGCIIVDLTNGGADLDPAFAMASMWRTSVEFFANSNKESAGALDSVKEETKSDHAMAGFASYQDGQMQFLETRYERETGAIVPETAQHVLGSDGCESLLQAFSIVSDVGREVTRVAVAACNEEYSESLSEDESMEAARRLACELLDDRKPLEDSIEHNEGPVSMSPHRLCRYTNLSDNEDAKTAEIFGAHTDSTFITAVPVSSVAGLEVYDEEVEKWYRPELAALDHWKSAQEVAGHDPSELVSTVEGKSLPWHARYLVCMPGELLQIASRNEIPSAIHRVIMTKDQVRYSAPILLRGRPGTRMDVDRYFGDDAIDSCAILNECNGLTTEEIHSAMQAK